MPSTITKVCYSRKQHITKHRHDSSAVSESRLVKVFAECLRHHMTSQGLTQSALAKKSGIGQTTISLYLRPAARTDTVSGKAGSPTLANIEALADALGIEAWELLRIVTPAERDILRAVARLSGNKNHH